MNAKSAMETQETQLKEVTEFWLISAPGEETCQQTWDALNSATSKQKNLSINFKFNIPELKVGTLDTLVGLSRDLENLDAYTEGVMKKLARYIEDVIPDKEKLKDYFIVSGRTMSSYLTKFQWDIAKFPTRQPLRNICDQITKQLTQIEMDLRSRAVPYNTLRSALKGFQKRATGSLMTRSLSGDVSKDDFVLNSDHLVTLLVVVHKHSENVWSSKYETLAPMVVPRSSRKIAEDSESYLFSVTLFRKAVDEFKNACVKRRFTIRDFVYNEEASIAEQTEIGRLETEIKKKFDPLTRWLKVNFGESFICWTHIKAMKVFVESVLRYGLPVNFQAMLLAPLKKSQKKLREVLNKHYRHLDNSGTSPRMSDIVDIPELNLNLADYRPYVFFKLSISICDIC